MQNCKKFEKCKKYEECKDNATEWCDKYKKCKKMSDYCKNVTKYMKIPNVILNMQKQQIYDLR